MHIIIVHLHYKTPEKGGALRSWYIANGLSQRGWTVEVISSDGSSNYRFEKNGAVGIHYVPVKYSNSFGSLRRIWAFYKFNRLALKVLKSIQHPDFLYCISTPLSSGIIGMKAKRKYGMNFFFEVGDLWPEAPIQMGVIRSGFLKKILFNLEGKIYRSAKKVIALSPSIEESILNRFPSTDVVQIPNMSDRSSFQFSTKNERVNELMPTFDFLIGSLGALGKANHLEYFITAAEYFLEAAPNVGFILMGEGSEEQRLRELSRDLPNMKILPFSSKKVVKEVMENIDAIYISYKSLPILETGSPNKLYDGLAAGKLVITNFKGWITELLEKHECGISYDPGFPDQLEEKLSPYIKNSALLDKAGAASRNLSAEFDKELLLDKLSESLSTP